MQAESSIKPRIKFRVAFTASAFRLSTRCRKPSRLKSSVTAGFINRAIDAASPRTGLKKSEIKGTWYQGHFKPDTEIFETLEFSFDILSQRLRELAFLNSGVKITIEDERSQKNHEFFYKGGLLSFVEHLNRAKSAIHPKVVHFAGEKEGVEVEIAMQWNDGYSENVFSFANNINTVEGGTHLIGFKSALTRT